MKKTLAGVLLALSALSHAEPFKIYPASPVDITIPRNGVARVTYWVMNTSGRYLGVVMRPIRGVTQILNRESCLEIKKMLPGQSCMLRLEIYASIFDGTDGKAPRVCSDTISNYCSTPIDSDLLKVRISE